MGCGAKVVGLRSAWIVLLATSSAYGAPRFQQRGPEDGSGTRTTPSKATPPPKLPDLPDPTFDNNHPGSAQHGGEANHGSSRPDNPGKTLGGTEPTTSAWRNWLARNLYRFEPAPVDAAAAHPGLPPHLADLSLRAEKRDLYRREVETALLPLLEDGDDRVRGAAALSLARVGLDPQSDRLLALLSDDHRRVRDQSLLAASLADGSTRYHLLRIAAGERAELRSTTSDSERERVRSIAAILLATRRDPRDPSAARLLGDWVADRSVAWQYRALAVEALGLAGASDAAERLIAIARDRGEPAPIRSAAVTALGQLGLRATAPIVIQLLDERDHEADLHTAAALAVSGLVDTGDADALRALLRAQEREGNAVTSRFLLLALGQVGGRLAENRIMRSLERSSSEERIFAALALALAARRSGSLVTATPLFDLLRDSHLVEERCALAVALGLTGQPRALEPLAELALRGPSPEVRRYAVVGLYLLAHAGGVSVLEHVLNDDDNLEVRMQAMQALARLDPTGSSALIHALNGPGAPATMERAMLIESLGLTRDPGAIEPLLALLRNGKAVAAEREAATLALGLVYESRTAPPTARIGEGGNFQHESPEIAGLLSLAE
jgi:HEAT repeat protein